MNRSERDLVNRFCMGHRSSAEFRKSPSRPVRPKKENVYSPSESIDVSDEKQSRVYSHVGSHFRSALGDSIVFPLVDEEECFVY